MGLAAVDQYHQLGIWRNSKGFHELAGNGSWAELKIEAILASRGVLSKVGK